MDVFFDYDQQKQVGYGPTVMGAGPSRNSLPSSSLAPQEANSPGQNYYLNMLLANCFQCNQQASSTVNQMFQPFSPESIDSKDTQIIETRKRTMILFSLLLCKKEHLRLYLRLRLHFFHLYIKNVLFIFVTNTCYTV